MIIDRFWVDIVGYVALGFSLSSFALRDAKKTKLTIAVSQFFLSSFYTLISAWTSAALQAVLMFRSIASSFTTTINQKHIVFAITLLSLFAFTAFTWIGPKSLFPLVGSSLASIALCYCNNKLMRIFFIGGCVCWFINAYIWDSIPLMLSEVVKIGFNSWTLYALTKEDRESKRDLANAAKNEVEEKPEVNVIED